jgi:HK97 family phage prohead protease
VSYIISDIDGTLTTTGNTPRTDYIGYLQFEAAAGTKIIIVSARPVSRLDETRKWLNDNKVPHSEVHLNDFPGAGQGPNVGLAFKKYKYELLIKQYGLDQIDEVIDNDPDVRTMAESLGLQAETPQSAMADYLLAEAPSADAAGRSLTDRQEEMIAEYISIANDYGPFDQTSGPNGAHYATGENNPFKNDGLVCGHCKFYQPGSQTEGRCAIVAGPIDPQGICKLWVIEADEVGVPLTEVPLAATDAPLAQTANPMDDMGDPYAGMDDSVIAQGRAMYQVPAYIRAAASKGLDWYSQGLAGGGLQLATVAEARDLAAGRIESDKLIRLAAWIRRHRADWEGVAQNSDRNNADFPGPGAVAGYLWGVETANPDATDRVLSWADALIAAENREIVDMKEKEVRSLPIGEFRLAEAGADGQRTFTGYASIWNSASAGLPFEEKIAPNAFKRSLSRAAAGQKIIAFLFGHDETRALATTASGRLQLTEDATGLRVEAKLDPSDPDAAKVISMLTHESAAAGMSFGFQKVQDAWDGNNRTIKEANLFEVSILAAGGQTPAYPATLGLTAIRQVTAPKIGVEAEALMATLESVKAGRELSTEELAVIDAVRSKLAPKPVGIDPSIAAALLAVSAAESDAL